MPDKTPAQTVLELLEMINALLPDALAAYAAIKAESGQSDDEILDAAKVTNAENRARLLAIINS